MKKATLGALIIGSAIIWGAIILGCSFKLKGTDCYQEIQQILSLGFMVHLLFIWGPIAGMMFKKGKEN